MGTILNKVFFGGLFIFLSWKGLDGLLINIFYHTTESYDILELEQSENIDARNIEIINGIVFRDNFIYYESNELVTVDMVFPLLSNEQIQNYNNSEPITIKVLFRLFEQSRNCLTTGICLPEDSVALKGLVKIGLENLNRDDFEALESDLLKLDKNVILVEPEDEPIVWYWNLAIFVVGTVFGFTILKSFFRRATSLRDYWRRMFVRGFALSGLIGR